VGGIVRGRSVRINVHVESAPWVHVDRVEIRRASAAANTDDADNAKGDTKSATASAITDAKDVKEVALADGAIGADVAFTLQAAKDDAFIVVASGPTPLTPVLGAVGLADADAAAILPWAMTGAIWIDADGNGESLGRIVPVGPSPGPGTPLSRSVLLRGAGPKPAAEPISASPRAGKDAGPPENAGTFAGPRNR
jgi:hypothetical protein